MRAPPVTVAPERLFRLLLATPRPTAQLAWRLTGAEHIALHVRGLTSLEVAAVVDASHGIEPPQAQHSHTSRGLIAASVMAGDSLAFPSADYVGMLPEGDFAALSAEVRLALGTCSPAYAVSDVALWGEYLFRGAQHLSNWYLVHELANCVDVVLGAVVHKQERPDRYFGRPVSQLTDGQLMAYHAARAVVAQESAKNG